MSNIESKPLTLSTHGQFGADKTMTCIGCEEQMDLALVHRGLHATRMILFCSRCGETFWKLRNWIEVKHDGLLIRQRIRCVACDRQIVTAFLNGSIPNAIIFCKHCADKMVHQHRWEECRRGRRDEDLSGYSPKILDMGLGSEQKRGH